MLAKLSGLAYYSIFIGTRTTFLIQSAQNGLIIGEMRSMARRVKVIIYGLFPTVYFTTAPCCHFTPPEEVGHGEEQLLEYPWWMIHDLRQAAKIAEKLSKYEDVRVELVSADSLKGIWLSLRYHLRGEPAVIINGWVFKGPYVDPDLVNNFVRGLLNR